jgi:hypothetical protein
MPDSSGESIFRRSPTVSIAGRNFTDARYKTRYNAYVSVKSSTGGSLPQPGTTFNDTYSTGRPQVVLNSVTIYEGQEYGSLLQAEVQFTCYSKAAFDTLSKQFLTLRNGDQPVTVNINFGLVGAPFSNADGSVTDLMIYNFGYQLDKSNAYVCTFKAMGSAVLADEVEISADNRISEIGLVYQDLSKDATNEIPVTTIPELIKSLAQEEGFKATFELEPAVGTVSNPTGHILIANHPGNFVPDSEFTKTIYAILQSIGLAGGDDASKLIYCSLELLIGMINKYIMPKTGKLANVRYKCDSTVTTGAYLEGVCSADPLNILLVGSAIGDYGSASGLDVDEYLDTNTIPNMIEPLSGDKYDYSKIFLSYAYMSNKHWGATSNTKNTEDAAKDSNDKPAETKFKVGTLLKGIFEDISNATGGAVKLTTFTDPKDPNTVLIIPANESTSTLRPVRFDPLNGDGITRECVISCNPASADAYAIAAGKQSYQSDTVKATGPSGPDTAVDLGTIRTEINNIRTKTMALSGYSADQVSALRDRLNKLTHACAGNEISEGKIPITSAQFPLKLEITLDGITGFRFGDVVETTFLPDNYLRGGIHAGFIVQRVVHTITNNDWSTKLETVCDLIKT